MLSLATTSASPAPAIDLDALFELRIGTAANGVEFVAGQFTLSAFSIQAATIAGVRPHWPKTSRRTVKRITRGVGIGHFVMAITERCWRRGAARAELRDADVDGKEDGRR